MKLVVGLGNPGRQYQNTRHNVGFDVLKVLAERHFGSTPTVKHQAELVEIRLGDEKVLLVAPQTYMNLSGRAVQPLLAFYQLETSDLLVICDDLNLSTGRLRFRGGGSAGGQKGLQNICQMLGTQDVPRLRIGIGKPPAYMDTADYVLAKWTKGDLLEMETAVPQAADGVECWAQQGLTAAMNTFNGSSRD